MTIKLFANSADHDQTPHPAASDLGLHCLHITLFWGLQTIYEPAHMKMIQATSKDSGEPRISAVSPDLLLFADIK